MVELYLPLIREVQPRGPYRLAGWSAGGTISYELACRLIDEGEQVQFLGLLDIFLPVVIKEATSGGLDYFDEKYEMLQLLSRGGEPTDFDNIKNLVDTRDMPELLDYICKHQIVPEDFLSLPMMDASTLRCILATRHAINRAIRNHSLVGARIPLWFFEANESDVPASNGWRDFIDDIHVVSVKQWFQHRISNQHCH